MIRASDRLVAALQPDTWARANRELLAKIVTELTYEEVLAPERLDTGDACEENLADSASFRLFVGPDARLAYRARRRFLGHWRVEPGSLRWLVGDAEKPLPEVAEFVVLAAAALGVDPSTTANGLCELANTLLSDVWQLERGRSSAELVDLEPALVEGEMRGHPWIVANKGRLGFDADDLATFAPEAQRPLHLLWVAAAPGRADARHVTGLDHHTVVHDQVGDETWQQLQDAAAEAGLDPSTATYLPVHPWQWRERIVPLHAADIARRDLVLLGEAQQRYLPQQSIRTLVDADRPERRYLKLPVSILNTSVYRGLPRERTLVAPALTEWLVRLADSDRFLVESGLVLLGEVASVSVGHPAFAAITDVPYQHTEMLGAIWRDSVTPLLRPGERALTLAALLHRDPHGVPLVGELIARSGLSVDQWIDELHKVTLPPLVHMLYRYGVTFSPHGQNCLLVLRDGVPTRLVVKDFVDDAMVAAEPLPELETLPPEVGRVLGDGLEAPVIVQWIQSGLLVCVYRYLSEVVDDDLGYPEAAFWASAAAALRTYQERFEDELADRFALFDLDAPAFVKLCLNRVRLLERGYADDAERPLASAVGLVDNPLALPAEVFVS